MILVLGLGLGLDPGPDPGAGPGLGAGPGCGLGSGPGPGPGSVPGPGCNWLHVLLLQVEALKQVTQEELLSWFQEQRNRSRKLSVHVSDL